MSKSTVSLIANDDVQVAIDKLCAVIKTSTNPDTTRALQKVLYIISDAPVISKDTYLNEVIDLIDNLIL